MFNMYVYKTPINTYRFEAGRDKCTSKLRKFMDSVSFNGDSEQISDIYFSWEIGKREFNSVIDLLKGIFHCNIFERTVRL